MSALYVIVCYAVDRCPIFRLQPRLWYQGLESVVEMDFWISFAVFCGRYRSDKEGSPGFEPGAQWIVELLEFSLIAKHTNSWPFASI